MQAGESMLCHRIVKRPIRNIVPRSDIFSFGLVLYEMLSGRRAFSGDSSLAMMNAIVKDAPPALQTSPALEKIVKRCLEKNPEDRYQRMSELKVDLVKATASR
jgi:eukaryotic-like serine/threonine-protein kinase